MSQKILLAEDDNDMRRFLVKALQKAGYRVISYDNGASAYDRLREEPFSLLLTDIVMPEMDGIELARRATELDPDHQGHVHHRLRRRGAESRFERARRTPRCFPSPSTCANWSAK
jgi:CheY-like chemotaxis protein